MPLLTWNDSYSVGVARCDDDHKKLFSLLNALHESMSVGASRSVISPVVQEMRTYAQTHFRNEESLMQQASYPELAAHRAEHVSFLAKVAKFQEAMEQGTVNVHEVSRFLLDWLVTHIKGVDRRYGPHLNASGLH